MFTPLTSATPILTADKPGRYVIELIVNDGVNASAPIQATVIFYKPNTPPAVSAGPDQTFTSSTLVNLSGTATDVDPGDTRDGRRFGDEPRGRGRAGRHLDCRDRQTERESGRARQRQ